MCLFFWRVAIQRSLLRCSSCTSPATTSQERDFTARPLHARQQLFTSLLPSLVQRLRSRRCSAPPPPIGTVQSCLVAMRTTQQARRCVADRVRREAKRGHRLVPAGGSRPLLRVEVYTRPTLGADKLHGTDPQPCSSWRYVVIACRELHYTNTWKRSTRLQRRNPRSPGICHHPAVTGTVTVPEPDTSSPSRPLPLPVAGVCHGEDPGRAKLDRQSRLAASPRHFSR